MTKSIANNSTSSTTKNIKETLNLTQNKVNLSMLKVTNSNNTNYSDIEEDEIMFVDNE
mgnify:FL=1